MNAEQSAIAARISTLAKQHQRTLEQARDCVASPRRPLIQIIRKQLKQAKGECYHALNDARQKHVIFADVQTLTVVHRELQACDVALHAADEVIESQKQQRIQRCLEQVLDRACGEAQRRAWFEEAHRLAVEETERLEARRLVATNAINLGSTGGMRTRKYEERP